MKKIIALFAALIMALGMSVSVMAADDNTITNVEVDVAYTAVNAGTTAPAETLAFKVAKVSVRDAETDVTLDNMPMLLYNGTEVLNDISLDFDGAGNQKITMTLPEYDSVGVYTYKITPVSPTDVTAGVTYDERSIYVKITVLKDTNGVEYVAGVAYAYSADGNDKISDGKGFEYIYKAASVSVQKLVTGNMGDDTKKFDVTVTFAAPEGKTVKSAMTYNVGTTQTPFTCGKTIKIQLADKNTVTFSNIPYGVLYTVVEDDYTSEGYDEPLYTLNDGKPGKNSVSSSVTDSNGEKVVITNNKDGAIATGVVLDNLPYVLLLAVVIGGAVVMFLRKRSYERD